MFLSDEAIADHRTLVAEIHLHISMSHDPISCLKLLM
jgi:hypothetical protein